ncbi:MAG: tetratricopeptide repeat protein [Anaerolineales bacterium]|nr:tetratricopeptide repeat protein [Anaerolineales bacterium]MCW5854785.1 tetratricopeptide repeat protein [Anaerolineales bacterium]
MAEIALRTYLSQIESLIDAGQTNEALAHCRHILERFPKNIATYRLMAKAYLEAQQHTEAADIFQRVLASCPDDFVAHIGMSIVGEEAGDADAAIWHMERAFEAQPSNRAVQDELRRLYTAREGYAPPKVRLTRGALARMYAHGDLFNQAITELRSALAEDPERPDLQVLLAEMLLKSQRQNEAIQVCQQLIEKMPYCLFPNRAMAEILGREQRDIEAAPYLERVQEMDPYAAQTDTREAVDNVPADSVMLEKLARELEDEENPSPYAAEVAGSETEDLPDWLSVEMEDGEVQAEDAARAEETPVEPQAGRTSSLLESLESLEPGPVASEDEQLQMYGTRGTAALVEDAVPDWLRELGPAMHTTGDLPEDEAPQPRKLSWTEELRDAGLQPTSLPEDEEPLPAADEAADEADLPDSQATQVVDDEESLSWLENLAASQGVEEEELLTTPEERQLAKPDWAPEVEAPSEEPQSASPALSWLDSLDTQDEAPGSAESSGPPPAFEAAEHVPAASPADPDRGSAEAQAEDDLSTDSLRQIFTEMPEIPAEAETPSWLQELSAEIEETQADAPAPRALEETPDWLNELRLQTGELKPLDAEGQPAEENAPAESEPAPAEENELKKLDWLDELGPPKHQPASEWVPEAELSTEEAAAKAEAWETEDHPGIEAASEPLAPNGIEEEAQPIEDWLAGLDEAGVAETDTATDEANDRLAEQAHRSAAQAAEPLATRAAPEQLQEARRALNGGDLQLALRHYDGLTRRRRQLAEVIADLQAAASLQPDQIALWQALGDAYMRNNQLSQALECYTQAEDLL